MQPTHMIEAEAEMAYRRNRITEQFRQHGARERIRSGRAPGRHWLSRTITTD